MDELKRVYMKAYLRLATATPSRSGVHFHDDASRAGKIYIGYGGPFLTNTRT